MDAKERMLMIKAIDTAASLELSEFTGKWYVDSRIQIGNGTMLSGIAEHQHTPEQAINVFFIRITTLEAEQYLVSRYRGHRREYIWNGAAFAECTRDIVLAAQKAGVDGA